LKKYLCLPRNTNSLSVLAEFGIAPLHLLREFRMMTYAKKLIDAPIDHPVRKLFLSCGSSLRIPDHFSAPSSLLSIQHDFITIINSGKYIIIPARERDKSAALVTLLTKTSLSSLRDSLASQSLIYFKEHNTTKIANLIVSYTRQPYLSCDSLAAARLRARLRFNKINSNQNLFYRKKSPTSFCPFCSPPANENRAHILLHCPAYRSSRSLCLTQLRSLPQSKYATLKALNLPLLLDASSSCSPPPQAFYDITGSFILSVFNLRKF
jgi:hypothetical protein